MNPRYKDKRRQTALQRADISLANLKIYIRKSEEEGTEIEAEI
jgi:hypothetical protein